MQVDNKVGTEVVELELCPDRRFVFVALAWTQTMSAPPAESADWRSRDSSTCHVMDKGCSFSLCLINYI
jgi:hypothetical protein